jgi:WD40 repeat protein
VGGVTLSNDDRLLVVQGTDGTVHITTLADHRTVVGKGWPTRCPSFATPAVSQNDRLLAVHTFCGQVAIGEVRNARPTAFYRQRGQLATVAFDPSSQHLAVASWDDVVTVLEAHGARPVLQMVGHARGVNGVVYGPRGYLVTTSLDGTMRVWNAQSGQVLQIDHDVSSPFDPATSPNGRYVAAWNLDGNLRIWPLCPDCQSASALLAASRQDVVSPLTPVERAEESASR